MRILSLLLVASLLLAPGIAAEESTIMHDGCPDTTTEEHNQCHNEQNTPGVGAVAAIGLLGAVAFLARRRN